MEIKYVSDNNISLSKVKNGEVFKLNDELFMKIKDCSYNDSSERRHEWNCINLADGDYYFIPLYTIVKKVKASVVVEE